MASHKDNKIVKLSDLQHVLQRQSMYLGSIKPIQHETLFLNEDGKFEYRQYESVDGLLKIINEIIDNTLDEAIRTNFEHANVVNVKVSDTRVIIIDNGRGLPVVKEETTGEYMPVLAFTHARAGANFGDVDRTTVGMNGIGAFVCNCFSKMFKVITHDGKKRLVLTCRDNMSSSKCDVDDRKIPQGTTVIFDPDLERFGMEKIDELHKTLINQRLIHLAISYPQIRFRFNGKTVCFRNTKTYLKAFSETYIHVETDNYIVAVMPNDSDDFRQVSFVNGLDLRNGGNHVDQVTGEIVYRLKDRIAKRYREVKPGDIRNKLQVVVLFRNFPNPLFDSQTKERLTNGRSEIKEYLGEVDWDRMAIRAFKTPAIIDPIIETYKIRAELKARQKVHGLNKVLQKTKIKCDKYFTPTKDNTYLALCEGFSACGGLMSVLGREEIGYFSMRGVPMNAYELAATRALKNEELKNIVHIMGIDLTDKDQSEFNFGSILLAQDADCVDGDAIVMMEDGTKKISEIVPGDRVISHTGKARTVVDVIETKKTECVAITIAGERRVFSPNHMIHVMRDGEVLEVSASEIQDTDLFLIKKD